ncbi:uncharacterized protein LOC143022693 [Oratosquilla oratoria]|uniref:uncharacterized protein LOC143022693 n=1 Tax=Oratosquilla oratoria TaxID=337810 RepID=UPI003F764423
MGDIPSKSSRNPPKDQEATKMEDISSGKEASIKGRQQRSLPQRKIKSLECRHLSRGTSRGTTNPVVDPTEPPVNAQSCSKQTIDYKENYTFKSDLGSGGYGVTSLVINKTTGNICVAKIPTKGKGSPSEIQALAELTHPNVVRLVDVATQGKLNIIITEYCEGGTLDSVVIKHEEQPYQDWGDRVASYCEQLVRAVAYVHSKNFAHLDLKTENIVLSADHKIVKLIDFGMSRRTPHVYKRNIKVRGGTPWYMAPEVIDTKMHPYSGGKVDVWALGCVFYELCTGQVPYYKEEADELDDRDLLRYYLACCKNGKPAFVRLPSTFSQHQKCTLTTAMWVMLEPTPEKRIDVLRLGKLSFLQG